jgi:hypothetical protein
LVKARCISFSSLLRCLSQIFLGVNAHEACDYFFPHFSGKRLCNGHSLLSGSIATYILEDHLRLRTWKTCITVTLLYILFFSQMLDVMGLIHPRDVTTAAIRSTAKIGISPYSRIGTIHTIQMAQSPMAVSASLFSSPSLLSSSTTAHFSIAHHATLQLSI